MAISETYVDPSIAGDSGAGTVGDPYGDLQYALDTMTRDSTNGDRINIKAGSDEVLTAALSLATYGTPAANAPLYFQGYTSAAGDGGIGGISGNGSYSIISTSASGVGFADMHLHNSGSAAIVTLGADSSVINCEIDNSTGNGLVLGNGNIAENCYIHNIGGVGIRGGAVGAMISHNYLENGTNDFTYAIECANSGVAINNIINIDGSSTGIYGSGFRDQLFMVNNTIYSSSGTGKGIDDGGNMDNLNIVKSNYIEGFSGVGGVGIDTAGNKFAAILSNRYYNNTTNFDTSGQIIINSDNSATASSALTDPGSGDFSVGTDLKAGAYPTSFKGSSTNQYMDIGAAQRQEPAGGGGGRQGLHPIESGAV